MWLLFWWIFFAFVLAKQLPVAVYADSKVTEEYKSWNFVTDLNPDPHKSTYKENFIDIAVKKPGGDHRLVTSLAYCFRLFMQSMSCQCVFNNNEKQTLFAFKDPGQGFGFVVFHGIYYMFRLPHGIKLSPHQWYHICVSYEQTTSVEKEANLVMFFNGLQLVNKSIEAPQQLTGGFTLGPTWRLGNCGSDNPLTYSITRGQITDFNVWSRSLSTEEQIEFTSGCDGG